LYLYVSHPTFDIVDRGEQIRELDVNGTKINTMNKKGHRG